MGRTPTWTNTYLYGNDRLAQYQADMQYFGADGLGSVRQIYDASAVVVGSSRYDPYGNVMAQSGATSVFAFAGEQYDATGLTYLRSRYYSAAQGRFTTRDVWEGDANAPMSYNAWNYANGDPVNLTDPSGRDPWWADKTAYLTFDDGPDPNYTPLIAMWLNVEGAQATFFVIGRSPGYENRILAKCGDKPASSSPEYWGGSGYEGRYVVSVIKTEGHALGIHGWDHNNAWNRIEHPEIEVQKVVDALASINVKPDPLLRAPGGAFSEKVIPGYERWYYYGWDIPQKYYSELDGPGVSAETVLSRLEQELKAAGCPSHCPNDPIILLHSVQVGTFNAVMPDPKAAPDAKYKSRLLAKLYELGYRDFRALPRPRDHPGYPPNGAVKKVG